ncbi:FeoC-like transcriptional regulator [Adonisia turfae]|uniref:FeoC like transcriptional regulator n=1 Tax=Adonisia turfae CCMR0081 TaxID=2292702 RepID=A0A6M0RF48_9CYAN|nr:FeoC-like transcriptional regulator [Adonisia turfae]NEZ54835.1 FeoC like transcriptional regulator [Adonisia turfae CCMR0081]
MLKDIQTYIAQKHTVSMADLALHFHTDSYALQPMLQKLRRKGRIQELPMPIKCCGCTACSQDSLKLYEWIGNTDRPQCKADSVTLHTCTKT